MFPRSRHRHVLIIQTSAERDWGNVFFWQSVLFTFHTAAQRFSQALTLSGCFSLIDRAALIYQLRLLTTFFTWRSFPVRCCIIITFLGNIKCKHEMKTNKAVSAGIKQEAETPRNVWLRVYVLARAVGATGVKGSWSGEGWSAVSVDTLSEKVRLQWSHHQQKSNFTCIQKAEHVFFSFSVSLSVQIMVDGKKMELCTFRQSLNASRATHSVVLSENIFFSIKNSMTAMIESQSCDDICELIADLQVYLNQ